jgi:hypothetical protein
VEPVKQLNPAAMERAVITLERAFAGANDVMGKLHKRFVPELHWYLLIVGVDPELPLLSGDKRGTQPRFISARVRGRRYRSTGQGRATWMGDATKRRGSKATVS